nr:MAG TPA: hypothetical protein [Caudoviricetes sp.]
MALLYDNPVTNGKFDNRLLRLDLQSFTYIEDIEDDFCIGSFSYDSSVIDNDRLGYSVQGNYEWLIGYGKARAIDYDIKYRQVRKLLGHYISLGKSIYLHIFGIGNIKRKECIYEKTFSTNIYSIILRDSCTDSIAVITGAVNNRRSIISGFAISISKRRDISASSKKEMYYRKSNSPIVTLYDKKTDIEDKSGYMLALYTHIPLKTDSIPTKPMYIPMTNIKDMIKEVQ